MYRLLIDISTYSICVPFLFALVYYKKFNKYSFPVFFLVLAGTLTELFSTLYEGKYPKIFVNLFLLLEGFLIIKQLEIWLESYNYRRLIKWLILLNILVWVIEGYIIGINEKLLIFFIYFSNFFIVFLSTKKLNELSTSKTENFLRNPEFIFCSAFIIYFSFVLLIQLFVSHKIKSTQEFRHNLITILLIVNIVSNMLYAIGIYMLPKKQKPVLFSTGLVTF